MALDPPAKRPRSESSTTGNLSPPPLKRKIAPTTTSKTVSNFFKPASQKEPEKISFHIAHETLLVARHDNAHAFPRPKPVKIAAFDFDDTLITTKSGLKFARAEDDWKWWHPSVSAKLRDLHARGYAIVVLSNQAAVSLREEGKGGKGIGGGGTRSLNKIKGKIGAVFKALDLPMSVYAATGHDNFRKPRAGMWEQLLRDYGLSAAEGEVDVASCVFVGDAGGRAEDKGMKRKKDHSCSDRDLAANIGIAFHTPEEFFLDEDPRPFTRGFDPASYLAAAEVTSQTEVTPVLFSKKNDVDLVLFCGSPGAGKSSFYWRHMQALGYERVNQDLLKTRDKCMKVASQLLEDGKSVVVDNTNADDEVRGAWIRLARTVKVPIRLVHFTASAKLCEHNNAVRALGGDVMNPEKRELLPKMAFAGFTSRYREPKMEEGFQDITRVDFAFEGTGEQRTLWQRFWIS